MAFCTNCGAQLGESAAFCTSCGAKVGETPSVTPATGNVTPVTPATNNVTPVTPATGNVTPGDAAMLSRKQNVKNIRMIIIGAILVMAGMIMLAGIPSIQNDARKYSNQYRTSAAIGLNDTYSKAKMDSLNTEVTVLEIVGGIFIVVGAVGVVLGIRRQTKKYIRGK